MAVVFFDINVVVGIVLMLIRFRVRLSYLMPIQISIRFSSSASKVTRFSIFWKVYGIEISWEKV
jgi:hypothetical protein